MQIHAADIKGRDGAAGPLASIRSVYPWLRLFADGPTVIKNVGHIRIKETDRLAALEKELRRIGARVKATADSLRIQPGPLHGAEIETPGPRGPHSSRTE